ncbi:hypothetical protein PPL_04925 [Heterostelium album PN500]|uniref:B box-type domain-containing protein n=1 Tax=Heterostelium pallidum (strain ATCC 26659 / Pp 5 / PN500) TaxID=670386 RepID=D3B8Y1_HETP5|nr:hypothetical protein PPL_04925 [Heterostelium album PN500]EFA82020.1 hypothetical protein PPL_04925 [Heterostelium album PN500]|eukprot:XP_020434137.1 hypothetical protein PPL_04925 [Heterostelium album PN500]
MTIKCLNHQRSHEFICYQCNCLMCSKCIINHHKDHPDHSDKIEDIDDIKHSLSTLKLDDIIDTTTTNNNSNSNNFISQINNKLKSLWESLRSSTSRYQRLSITENDIKQHFEQLHQYLIIEEHKLQRDIINDKHTITNQINNNVNHLKYLLNIIMLINKFSSSDNNNTTTLYSTTTIMESITTSSSLQSFINHNNQTLFNEHNYKNNNYFNIDELLKQHSSDSSSLLLDIIHKYNNQFNESTTNTDNNNLRLSSYKLSIKQPDFNQLNSIIKQSIKFDNIESSESINTTTTNNDNKQSYIFTTHKSKGATLINTSNNNSIEELKFNYQFYNTFNSIVSIGEYIYIFGGHTNKNKWIKISMKSKSIEHIGDIEGIKGDLDISVCYDGQDHIYLVNGYHIKNRIDRFNIKTMKFESYHQLPDGYGIQASSMIFKGSLYSVSYYHNKLFQFDLTNRTITDHQINFFPLSGCHDNNGNFFIIGSNKRFIKYNVETKQTMDPNALLPTNGHFSIVMYHRESPTSSYIYSFGSSNDSNFKYSIESNQCEPFFRDIIDHDREWCACTSFTIYFATEHLSKRKISKIFVIVEIGMKLVSFGCVDAVVDEADVCLFAFLKISSNRL